MPLIRLDNISLAYGHHTLLDNVSFGLSRGERVCLLGRNGAGKSSLLRILSGERTADDGEVWRQDGIRVAALAQDVMLESDDCVFDVVAAGIPEQGRLIADYHHATAGLTESQAPADLDRLHALQQALEAAGGWQLEQRVETVLSRLQLDGEVSFATLSGGWRRRVLLAQALVGDPDVLLLDEPTNHLDIEAIRWLEDFMLKFSGALMFISHDRAFVRRLAGRIVELDRGVLSSWPGGYDDYLRRKAEQLETEARHAALFDKQLAQEEAWIRQGIKARRTRNEGRVRALRQMREERRLRRERTGRADIRLDPGEQSGRLVFEADNISVRFGEHCVIRDFSSTVLRGDRVGIIGPNGVGKTTLIRALLGDIEIDAGQVRRGSRLQTAWFDQQRAQLKPDRSVMDNVADGSQHVTVSGRRRHVAGYLRDFLFPPERLRSPVSSLSGGERNRLLLARLFARPANLLVMDEPTNDLDVETLELLEELLMEFSGTLLLVSHDREFLDNVVTSTLVFEGEDRIGEYVGGYSDWLHQQSSIATQAGKPATTRPAANHKPSAGKPRKLSYKDQRELDALPERIEALETEQSQLQQAVSEPNFYQQSDEEVKAVLTRLETVTAKLESCYARWEVLEAETQ